MVDIQSKEVIDKISEELKIQPSLKIPRTVAEKIQLQYNVNPKKLMRVISSNSADTGSSTVFTTDVKKRTFFYGGQLTVAKDAVNDGLNSRINISPVGSGSGSNFLRINYEPLTAGQFFEKIILPFPVELQKGSTIVMFNDEATASIDAAIVLFIREEDPQ